LDTIIVENENTVVVDVEVPNVVVITAEFGPQGIQGIQGPAWPSQGVQQAAEIAAITATNLAAEVSDILVNVNNKANTVVQNANLTSTNLAKIVGIAATVENNANLVVAANSSLAEYSAQIAQTANTITQAASAITTANNKGNEVLAAAAEVSSNKLEIIQQVNLANQAVNSAVAAKNSANNYSVIASDKANAAQVSSVNASIVYENTNRLYNNLLDLNNTINNTTNSITASADMASTKAASAAASASRAAESAELSTSNKNITVSNANLTNTNVVTSAASAASALSSANNAQNSLIDVNVSKTTVLNSEANAVAKANAAAISATAAASSATAAALSATNAAERAVAAASSAEKSEKFKTDITTSVNLVTNLFNTFDTRFLGAKSADPTVDNENSALQQGAIYYNTTIKDIKFYTGTTWTSPSNSATNSAAIAVLNATNASVSAAQADTSAAAALSSANQAASNASISTAAANTATTKAAESATNAANAVSAANSASASKDTVISNVSTATNAAATSSQNAIDAAASALAASNSATNAATSATNAATSSQGITSLYNQTVAFKNSIDLIDASIAANAVSVSNNTANAATSASTATTKAAEATTSAANASAGATNAATSATNAETSATNAATSATNAATSATNAATSATNAQRTIWRSGTGVPSNTLGVNGDYYINTETADIYYKNNGTYVFSINIKGTTPTISAGTVTTTAAGTNAEVTNTGTPSAAVFQFKIPKGDPGQGLIVGGNAGQVLVKNSATDYDTIWQTPFSLVLPVGLTSGGTGKNSAPAAQANLLGYTAIASTGLATATAAGVASTATSTASFISGTVLTIGGTIGGTGSFTVGMYIYGTNVVPGTIISSLGTGTGGAGTYNISISQTVTSTAISGGGVTTLTFASQSPAPFAVGSYISVQGVTPTGYNGYYKVITCDQTSVTYANGTTGTGTVNGFVLPVTELTNTSSFYQTVSGTGTGAISLPDTSTLQLGWSYRIANTNTSATYVYSSTGVQLISVTTGAAGYVTCVDTTINSAAAWKVGITEASATTGSGNMVLSTSPTITGTLNFTGSSGNSVNLGTAVTSSAITIGGTSGTGLLRVGVATTSQAVQIGSGANTASTFGTTTGSIAANSATLTIGTVSGTAFAVGMAITGTGVLPGTYIISGSGTSWTVNQTHTIAVTSVTITGTTQKSVDIGTGGLSNSVTQITLGSATSDAVSTTNINGTTKFGTNLANQLQIVGSATTTPVILSALGSDTNIDITLTPKGTGRVIATTGIKTRVQPVTVASESIAQSWSSDSYDQINLTLYNNSTVTLGLDTGTPTDGQKIMFRIKDDGTSRTIAFTSTGTNCFKNVGTAINLEAIATTASKTTYIGCIYNSTGTGTGTWDVIATGTEA
jgi:hypothetical protein